MHTALFFTLTITLESTITPANINVWWNNKKHWCKLY